MILRNVKPRKNLNIKEGTWFKEMLDQGNIEISRKENDSKKC